MPTEKEFVTAMSSHWHSLGHEESATLRKAWRQMAQYFNLQHEYTKKKKNKKKPWAVLPLPTGSGKTEGLCLYCAMLGKEKIDHPGVLIVTRLIKEANKLQDKINKFHHEINNNAGGEIAVSYHSKNKKEVGRLIHDRPILIVTHNAFRKVLEAHADGEEIKSNSEYFQQWAGGVRQLTVIDESLDVHESYHVTLEDIREAKRLIPDSIKRKYPSEIDALERIRKRCFSYIKRKRKEKTISPTYWRVSNSVDYKGLVGALNKAQFSPTCKKAQEEDSGEKVRKRIINTLLGVESLLSRECAYWKYTQHTFSTSYLILPTALNKAVVLDATAKINPAYEILKRDIGIVDVPKGIRNYKKVTLYVHLNHATGKSSIKEYGDRFFSEMTDYLAQKIGNDRRIFFCVHKDMKDRVGNYKKKFKKISVGHWGAIDGKNTWKSYSVAVIYGLPHLKPVDYELRFLACKNWIEERNKKKIFLDESLNHYTKIYSTYMLSVNLVQAMNRIRCRKISGRNGQCKKTDIYLFLLHKSQGEELIEIIKSQMPGIKIKYLDDGPTPKTKKDRSPYGKALIAYLKKSPSGEYPVKDLQKKLDCSESTFRRLIRKTKNPKNPFAKELLEIGVNYVEDWGRGAVSKFVKKR